MLQVTMLFFLSAAAIVASLPASNTSRWLSHQPIGLGPRQEHGVAGYEDTVYVVGGVRYNNNNSVETVNLVEYYTISDQKWHVAAPLPRAMNHPNVASSTDSIYVLGGLAAGINWTALADAYVYTPRNDSWRALAPLPDGTARGSSAVGLYNNTLYLAGGQLFLELVPPFRQPGLATVSSYDITTDSWDTSLPNLPEPRQHVSGAVVGSTFYVIGGREYDIKSYRNTTFALDLANPVKWQERAPLPTARGSLACAAIDTTIYCFGGEGDDSNANEIFSQVEAYDTINDCWSSLPSMTLPRHGTGAVALGKNIWIPGGGIKTAMAPVGIVDSFVFA